MSIVGDALEFVRWSRNHDAMFRRDLPGPEWFTADDSVFGVALVFPLQGPAGIFGPTCELCARLAAEEVNRDGGVLGRQLRLVPVDGSGAPHDIADEVEALVDLGAVQGVTGWHISSVRRALAPRIAHRVPYVYTALYEGGEDTAGVFLTSETPRDQAPAGDGSAGTRARGAALVRGGQRLRVAAAHGPLGPRLRPDRGGCVAGEAYLPLGTHDFEPVLRRVERSDADAVLMLLVGSDAVRFNRAFAAYGLHARCLRLSTLMDENMLVASGPEATEDLYSTAGSSPRWPTATPSTSMASTPPATASRHPPSAVSASPATRECCCWPHC